MPLHYLAAIAMLSTSKVADVIPAPTKMTESAGSLTLGPITAIRSSSACMQEAILLQKTLRASTGYRFNFSSGGAIELKVDSKLKSLGEEGYRIHFGRQHVTISAASSAGIFYGNQTFLQLFPPAIYRKSAGAGAASWTATPAEVEDSPRFPWRGAHMDVARHFMPKEFVLKFIDLMSMHKLNVFHWHLVDDNGWRVEIKRYPLLAEIGSKTDFSKMNPTAATRSASQQAGGFYTQEDIREVVRYAMDRHITVVPEIELPGHANAIISAYPELGNRRQIAAAGGDVSFLGGMDNVFNVDDPTIAFLKNVLEEVLNLFPSKFIHIGGDEVWKDPWKKNPVAQARMASLGLKNEEELQSWFLRQFDDYLVSKGRRLIGWDEILEGGLAPNAAVMSWRGVDGGIAAAKAGHDVVMSPTSHAYFDYAQSKLLSSEPKSIGGYVPLEKVYQFDPIPSGLTDSETKHILGGQANLWSEYIPHPKHMEYMAYPRLCAMAEDLWSPKDVKNWDWFQLRLKTHLERLQVLDVNFRPMVAEPKAAASWKSGEIGENWTTKEWDLSAMKIRPGNYQVVFAYTGGACRLDINWVEIVAADRRLARTVHAGRTGGDSKGNEYLVSIPSFDPGEKIMLRAEVRADGGSDSNGDIFLLPG